MEGPDLRRVHAPWDLEHKNSPTDSKRFTDEVWKSMNALNPWETSVGSRKGAAARDENVLDGPRHETEMRPRPRALAIEAFLDSSLVDFIMRALLKTDYAIRNTQYQ
jgi:hypothetical protein